MSELELATYDSWFNPIVNAIPTVIPDGFIYLRAMPGTCHSRMTRRDRLEEGKVCTPILLLCCRFNLGWVNSDRSLSSPTSPLTHYPEQRYPCHTWRSCTGIMRSGCISQVAALTRSRQVALASGCHPFVLSVQRFGLCRLDCLPAQAAVGALICVPALQARMESTSSHHLVASELAQLTVPNPHRDIRDKVFGVSECLCERC